MEYVYFYSQLCRRMNRKQKKYDPVTMYKKRERGLGKATVQTFFCISLWHFFPISIGQGTVPPESSGKKEGECQRMNCAVFLACFRRAW